MSPVAVLWTIVARPSSRARFLRPVAGAVPGTWHEAVEQARTLLDAEPGIDVWYVPTEDSDQHEEDRDNVLLTTGRRLPIRWDAAPCTAMPVHLAPCGDEFGTEADADAHAVHCGACAGVEESEGAHLAPAALVALADAVDAADVDGILAATEPGTDLDARPIAYWLP